MSPPYQHGCDIRNNDKDDDDDVAFNHELQMARERPDPSVRFEWIRSAQSDASQVNRCSIDAPTRFKLIKSSFLSIPIGLDWIGFDEYLSVWRFETAVASVNICRDPTSLRLERRNGIDARRP